MPRGPKQKPDNGKYIHRHPPVREQKFSWEPIGVFKLHVDYSGVPSDIVQKLSAKTKIKILQRRRHVLSKFNPQVNFTTSMTMKANVGTAIDSNNYYLTLRNYYRWIKSTLNFDPKSLIKEPQPKPLDSIDPKIFVPTENYFYNYALRTDLPTLRNISIYILENIIFTHPKLEAEFAQHIVIDELNLTLKISPYIYDTLLDMFLGPQEVLPLEPVVPYVTPYYEEPRPLDRSYYAEPHQDDRVYYGSHQYNGPYYAEPHQDGRVNYGSHQYNGPYYAEPHPLDRSYYVEQPYNDYYPAHNYQPSYSCHCPGCSTQGDNSHYGSTTTYPQVVTQPRHYDYGTVRLSTNQPQPARSQAQPLELEVIPTADLEVIPTAQLDTTPQIDTKRQATQLLLDEATKIGSLSWRKESTPNQKSVPFSKQQFAWDSTIKKYQLCINIDKLQNSESRARESRKWYITQKTGFQFHNHDKNYYLPPVDYFRWIGRYNTRSRISASDVGTIKPGLGQHSHMYAFIAKDANQLRSLALEVYQCYILTRPHLARDINSHLYVDELNKSFYISFEVFKLLQAKLAAVETQTSVSSTTSFLQSHQQSLNRLAGTDLITSQKWAGPAESFQSDSSTTSANSNLLDEAQDMLNRPESSYSREELDAVLSYLHEPEEQHTNPFSPGNY